VTRYVVSPDAACAVVDDGAVLLHMRTKRYYSLNETGATIWRLVSEDVPAGEIAARLAELYDVDRGAADEAVTRLLDDLAAEALVSVETA
jgi:hypothetical protein